VNKYTAIAVIAFGLAGVLMSLAFIEYGKVVGIVDLLQKQAMQAGAAESCHTCTLETAQGWAAFANYSIIGAVAGIFGIGILVAKRSKIAKIQ
jgi:hypothetical protein